LHYVALQWNFADRRRTVPAVTCPEAYPKRVIGNDVTRVSEPHEDEVASSSVGEPIKPRSADITIVRLAVDSSYARKLRRNLRPNNMVPRLSWRSAEHASHRLLERRRLLNISILGFVMSSALCGLLAFRLAQGLSGAPLIALSQVILLDASA
jgi:hypothetical protein